MRCLGVLLNPQGHRSDTELILNAENENLRGIDTLSLLTPMALTGLSNYRTSKRAGTCNLMDLVKPAVLQIAMRTVMN